MNDETPSCALCGLPVEVTGFELKTKEGTKRFCCEGCLGIYKMLNEENLPQEDDRVRQ